MATRARIDDAQAAALARQGLSGREIADRLGFRPPAVYRALKRAGAMTPKARLHATGPAANYPQAAKRVRNDDPANWKKDFDAEEREIAARRIPPRDPCFRCGARGDLGCGCSKVPVGWRAG